MPNIPNSTHAELLAWLEARRKLWEQNYAALGMSQAQYDEFALMLQSASDAAWTAYQARSAAFYATQQQNRELQAIREKAGDLISLIKGHINTSDDSSLWGLAGLEPPARRGTAPAPAAPTHVQARLDASGSMVVTWKARQPRGTSGAIYSVSRALNGELHETLLDVVGGKKFIDDAIPLGTRTVRYHIRARRLSRESETAGQTTVQLGRIAQHAATQSRPVATPIATLAA